MSVQLPETSNKTNALTFMDSRQKPILNVYHNLSPY